MQTSYMGPRPGPGPWAGLQGTRARKHCALEELIQWPACHNLRDVAQNIKAISIIDFLTC